MKQRIKFWDQEEANWDHQKVNMVPLPENIQYDDPDIDFEIVKRFYYLSTAGKYEIYRPPTMRKEN